MVRDLNNGSMTIRLNLILTTTLFNVLNFRNKVYEIFFIPNKILHKYNIKKTHTIKMK